MNRISVFFIIFIKKYFFEKIMPRNNKFSAFAGVYTPSLLTILGVIMYMRLGWVVGEAGLINALIIIVVAHIISVTTGLSISSIATDKKIKAGGIYYMLSRSLGLPMGGAIGIALFVGTALSISMYVIGFAESFLSIPSISQFLHLSPSIESYQIVGTAVIILLVILAFISTSLAIKSQFLILGAIVLSLISIAVGFFINPQFIPENPIMHIANGDVSLEYVFSIFFPAVTGFTAGVAMSGDLRNPKKGIPTGTLLSILTGFIVYLGLAVGFAYFVNRDALINNTDIAMRVSWIPGLVVAGIWGATLSSALGGILGGPRILQAIASDRLMPRIFSKGYGETNEPRNALLLIFVIAELGILKGNLNAIAGIVTMFYLATYGFINLSYFLESWASSDFRPSFKIAKSIAVVGFVFAFVIMFKLDMVAMVLAFVIMGAIYFILKRKETKLEYGDIWQSVWTSIIKKGLQYLSKHPLHDKNWTPNIILFNNHNNKESNLIDFGKNLIGHYGMLSVFDLVETTDDTILFAKHQQNKTSASNTKTTYFKRQLSCRTIYDGIEMAVRAFGFTGIEPNTVIMEWERQSRNPQRFFETIRTIRSLDYSLLLLDYDVRVGFGKKKTIDIWWRGGTNNGHLALLFSKFLSLSPEWNQAHIRLLVVSNDGTKIPYIQRKIDAILSKMRIDVESKIINNQLEQRPINDIIRAESKNTDLSFVGLPDDLENIDADAFVESTNQLLHDIGTVILIRVSSVFKKETLPINQEQNALLTTTAQTTTHIDSLPPMSYSLPQPIAVELAEFFDDLFVKLSQSLTLLTTEEQETYKQFIAKLKTTITDTFSEFSQNFEKIPIDKFSSYFSRRFQLIIDDINAIVLETKTILSETLSDSLETIISDWETHNQTIANAVAPNITASIDKEKLSVLRANRFISAFAFFKNQQFSRKKPQVSVTVALRSPLKQYLAGKLETLEYDSLQLHSRLNIQFLLSVGTLAKHLQLIFARLRHDSLSKQLSADIIAKAQKESLEKLSELETYNTRLQSTQINRLADDIASLRDSFGSYFSEKKTEKNQHNANQTKQIQMALSAFPSRFIQNLTLTAQVENIENRLLILESVITTHIKECLHRLRIAFETQFVNAVDTFLEQLNNLKNGSLSIELPDDIVNSEPFRKYISRQVGLCNQRILKAGGMLPEYVEVFEELPDESVMQSQKTLNIIKLPVRQIIRFLLNDKLSPMAEDFENQFVDLLTDLQDTFISTHRLVKFTADTGTQDFAEFLNEQIEMLQTRRNDLLSSANELRSSLLNFANDLTTHLTLYGLKKIAPNIKTYFLQQQKQKSEKKLMRRWLATKQWMQQQIVWLRFGKIQASLYTRRQSHFTEIDESPNTVFSSISQQVYHTISLQRKLPFYYKQLFLSKQVFYNEFFVGRVDAVKKAETAISMFSKKHAGALLILGENHNGKSFFAQYIASQTYDKTTIFHIQAPISGATEITALNTALQTAVGLDGTPENIFKQIPKNAVFIFDDLELWWTHSVGGEHLVNTILKWTELFASRHLFIFTVNSFAYRFLKLLTPIEQLLLSTIYLPPMKVETIRESILLRHKATNLHFIYKNKEDSHLSVTRMADLMLRIYRISYGNIGISLALWAQSIQMIDDTHFELSFPELPAELPFHKLSQQEQTILYQLVIHNRLAQQRLLNLFPGKEREQVMKSVRHLYHIGLLKHIASHSYTIEPLWYVAVITYFSNQKRL